MNTSFLLMERFMKKWLALLPLIALAAGCAGHSLSPQSQTRIIASAKSLVLGADSPESQRVENDDTGEFLGHIAQLAKASHPAAQKTWEEMEHLRLSLEARGFEALEKPIVGLVSRPTRSVTVYRKNDQAVPALNGEAAYTLVSLEFYSSVYFVKKGAKLTPDSVVPSTRLHGTLLLRCAADRCSVGALALHSAGIVWENPSSARGANSSAGGAGRD